MPFKNCKCSGNFTCLRVPTNAKGIGSIKTAFSAFERHLYEFFSTRMKLFRWRDSSRSLSRDFDNMYFVLMIKCVFSCKIYVFISSKSSTLLGCRTAKFWLMFATNPVHQPSYRRFLLVLSDLFKTKNIGVCFTIAACDLPNVLFGSYN